MSKNIEFLIDREGNVKIDKLEGYGSGCLEATKFLEQALGGVDESSRRLTEEINKPISASSADEYIEL
jgi:hypothetical protein